MQLKLTTNLTWGLFLTVSITLALVICNELYAGVSDHLAREAKLKSFEGNTVSTLSEYANLTYLVELIALGLVAAALLAVTFSIVTRREAGKREHKKILSLRRSAEQDKKLFDETVSEINNIGKKIKDETAEVQEQVVLVAETVSEAEQRAENIGTLELEMKQLVDGTTERMSHIQEYWDQQLKDTVNTINQINEKLDNGLSQTAEHGKQTEDLLKTLKESYNPEALLGEAGESAINGEIKETLDLTLQESKQLLTQIKDYQQQADSIFSSFQATLSQVEAQAHDQFDEIFNAADIARQELNANLDESREYVEIFRNTETETKEHTLVLEGIDTVSDVSETTKTKRSTSKETQDGKDKKTHVKGRHGRPIIGMNDAEDLTDPSLIKNYGKDYSETEAEDKNLVNLFSKFRHHGS